MASIQETLYAALAADASLTAVIEDRLYPGQIPDEEAGTPWLYYAVPESSPVDDLEGDPLDAQHQVEFHALGDTYDQAKSIIDAVFAVLDTYVGGQISRAFWQGTSEESTEDGYHHVARFTMWGSVAAIVGVPGGRAKITTGTTTVTLYGGSHVLTLGPDGLQLDGSTVGATGPAGPQGEQGEQGVAGDQGEAGEPGPNEVTDETATDLTGILYANGSFVLAAPALLYAATGTHLRLTAQAVDVVPAAVRAAASQTADLFRVEDQAGNHLARFMANGTLDIPGGTEYGLQVGRDASAGSGNWTLAAGRGATISGTRNFSSAVGSLAVVSQEYATRVGGGAEVSAVGGVAVGANTLVTATNSSALGRSCLASHSYAVAIGFAMQTVRSDELRVGSGSAGDGVRSASLALAGVSDTTGNLDLFQVVTSWATSTHASRKGRATLVVHDTAARECVRVEASGSEPMLGFYGASAVARQLLATGTGATVDDVIGALQTLGLLKQS